MEDQGRGMGMRMVADFGDGRAERSPCDKEKERDACCDKREDHRLADGYVILGCAEATSVYTVGGEL